MKSPQLYVEFCSKLRNYCSSLEDVTNFAKPRDLQERFQMKKSRKAGADVGSDGYHKEEERYRCLPSVLQIATWVRLEACLT